MKINKRLLRPERLRRVPEHFSWLDHRLVRDNHLHDLSPNAMALYLFLVVVSDAQGLSYYGDKALVRSCGLSHDGLESGRSQLIARGLIAYQKPLYQVLDLAPVPTRSCSGKALSIAQLFEQAMSGKEGLND